MQQRIFRLALIALLLSTLVCFASLIWFSTIAEKVSGWIDPENMATELYTVQPDDTLWSVAFMYGTDAETLIELNKDSYPALAETPRKFSAGWTLRVPAGRSSVVMIVPAKTAQVMPTRDGNGGWFDQTLEIAIIKLVNDERKRNALHPFIPDETLSKIARQRAIEVSFKFSHEGLSVICPKCGENIGWGGEHTTANNVVTAWMNSESHRANVLFPKQFNVGVGAYRINGRVYFTLELKQD